MLVGVVVLGAASWWWSEFYGPLVRGFGDRLSGGSSCLYSNGGLCNVAEGLAQIAGKTPYSPTLWWAGGAALLVGALVKLFRRAL